GSVAFGALPRVILGAAKNADTGARILVRAKSNIGPDGGGYEYELRQNELERYPGIVASGVLWGEAIEGGARELLAATEAEPDDEEQTALDEAEAFRREELEGGRVRSKDIIRSARDAGITQRTLERARKSLKVRAERVQELGGSAWYLSLPPDQDRQA